ncbi:helix-turn-helix domain-containing protein [Nocardia brasiliensis]|uniref:helix-turn-helix domain-containing protein n=1 Tax=Nocardia brasiliensis TaxID=37326 RepID=UPI0024586495|nr:helix-turn-helix transcriptional regulator [Nocardia brasiliensis]
MGVPSDIPPNEIGTRLREIRVWRGLSLDVAGGLAGLSYGYLGKLERGDKALTSRATLEAVARALRVAPEEFTGRPWDPDGPSAEAHAGLIAFENALDAYELGEDPGVPVRPWPVIATDLGRLEDHIQAGDYARQGELGPALLAELHALYSRDPALRTQTLRGLIVAYSSAVWTTKRLAGRGLPLLAARAAQQCAALLESPAWIGFAAWLRGDATGGLARPEQYRRAVKTADELSRHLDDAETAQMYGMLHLSASLASAAQQDRDTAFTHLAEAGAIADRMDAEVGVFGRCWFGRANVGIWRATIGNEFGEGARVARDFGQVAVAAIPSPVRQAEYFAEVGRALIGEPKHKERGLALLLRAEDLAPQRIRADIFVREAVADQLRAARRDAGGRDLRGLAWRIGIAPGAAPRD